MIEILPNFELLAVDRNDSIRIVCAPNIRQSVVATKSVVEMHFLKGATNLTRLLLLPVGT